MPVADGMVVHTDSDDVRAARRMALELLLSDHAGECVAPCAARCPAGLDIPGFVREIASGDNGRAMERDLTTPRAARARSGRICPRLCEQRCRRCDSTRGSPSARCTATPPTGPSRRAQPVAAPSRGRATGKTRRDRRRRARPGSPPPSTCCRRATPARCSTPHPRPGGMLRYGIPAYRLPKDALDAEIDAIRAARRRVPHGHALGRGLHARRPAARARRRVPRHRRAARAGAALRGRGTGALRRRSSCEQVADGQPAGARATTSWSSAAATPRWTARAPRVRLGARGAGPVPPHAARDALPDGGSGGRRGRRRRTSSSWWRRCASNGAATPRLLLDLPAHGRSASPTRPGGGARCPVAGSEFTRRVLHRDRRHRPVGGTRARRARGAARHRLGHRRRRADARDEPARRVRRRRRGAGRGPGGARRGGGTHGRGIDRPVPVRARR